MYTISIAQGGPEPTNLLIDSLSQTDLNGNSHSLGMTFGQKVESTSRCLSRLGLRLQINSS